MTVLNSIGMCEGMEIFPFGKLVKLGFVRSSFNLLLVCVTC